MRTLRSVLSTTAVVGAVLLPLLPSAAVQAQTVKIGIADTAEKRPDYQPLLGHLNSGGELKFDVAFYDTADELYARFQLGAVRLALFGPVLYARAHKETGAVPIVKDKPNASVIFVRDGSPIRSIADLPGHRFAFGYEESTTSNLIPRHELWRKLGRDALTDSPAAFERDQSRVLVSFAGSHTAVVDEVIAGRSDAGAVVDVVFERNAGRGLRKIFTSDPFPGVPLVCNPDEPEAFRSEVRRLFLSYRAPQNAPNHHFRTGATEAHDSDYDLVRYLCKAVLNKNYD